MHKEGRAQRQIPAPSGVWEMCRMEDHLLPASAGHTSFAVVHRDRLRVGLERSGGEFALYSNHPDFADSPWECRKVLGGGTERTVLRIFLARRATVVVQKPRAWVWVEPPWLQILVVVANIQTRVMKAKVEKDSR